MYLVLMRENDQVADQNVFKEYIKLERKYAEQAFQNLAKGVAGDRGELVRFFRGTDFILIRNLKNSKLQLSCISL